MSWHTEAVDDNKVAPMASSQARLLGDSTHIEQLLTRHLPYTLPLLRRLQFGSRNPTVSVLVAGLEDDEIFHYATAASPKPRDATGPWIVGVIDPDHRPGTECWVFSSLQLESAENSVPRDIARIVKKQFLSVITHIQPTDDAEGPVSLIGTVHSRIANILATCGPEDDQTAYTGPLIDVVHAASIRLWNGIFIDRISPAYGKYIYSARSVIVSEEQRRESSSLCDTNLLPDGLRWSAAEDRDYEKIMSLNRIVQSPAVLKDLPSCVLRKQDTGEAVAWGFLDIDGSMRTVHVEPEYRKKGLAARLLRRLIHQHKDLLEQALKGDRHLYLSADIRIGNDASLALFHGIGAKHMWDVVWVTVNLERAREEWQRWVTI